MLRRAALPVLAVLAVVLVGCGEGADGDVAATVGGTAIPREELARQVDLALEGASPAEGQDDADRRAETQRQVLSGLILLEGIEEAAAELGVEVTEEEVEARLTEEAEAAGGAQEFEAALEQQGTSLEAIRLQVRFALLREELLAALLQDETIEQATVRHILVETEQEAQTVIEQLEEGANFGALARDSSIGPSAPQGGELGTAPRGSYVPAFEEAVWNAEVGEIVGPVETEFGFHVIEVTDFSETRYEETEGQERQQLEASAGDPALQEFVRESFADLEIDVADRFGEWDPEQQQVVPDQAEAE